MRDLGAGTKVDDGAACIRARDGWAGSAGQYFLQAYRAQETDPTAAVQALRQFLEGWANAACTQLDPDFWPTIGQTGRATLEDMLRRLAKLVDRRVLASARGIQERGNYFSHNQGEFKTATSREAGAALLLAADLLEQLHRDVLHTPPPSDVALALSQVERPSRTAGDRPTPAVLTPLQPIVSRPRRSAMIGGAATVAVGAIVVTVVLMGMNRSPASAPGAAATSGRVRATSRSDQARLRLGGYLSALRAGNVDEILAFHAVPTDRLYVKTAISEADLRSIYTKAPPSTLGVDALDLCQPVSESPIAFLCPTEPKQQCFVFDENLKLTARYDYQGRYGQPSTCPP